MTEEKKRMLIVISGPSGAGKGTICKLLLDGDPTMKFSVSVTTRAPREGEIHGVHYFFISEDRYDELLSQDAFLEHATVHGHRYGTLKSQVEEINAAGYNVVLDIDPQGAKEVLCQRPDCVSIFILPPSYAELKQRLVTRNTDDPAEIERRLQNARGEIAQLRMYQYAVVNVSGDPNVAYQQVKTIITAEQQRTTRYFPVVE